MSGNYSLSLLLLRVAVLTLARSWLGLASTLIVGSFISTDLDSDKDKTTKERAVRADFLVKDGKLKPKDGTAMFSLYYR
jgi:hypothetical protein